MLVVLGISLPTERAGQSELPKWQFPGLLFALLRLLLLGISTVHPVYSELMSNERGLSVRGSQDRLLCLDS